MSAETAERSRNQEAANTGRPEIKTYTLADLKATERQPQLVPPFIAPDGVTVGYGPGGVGKGLAAVHFTRHLVREHHMRVCVLDFENHPNEWARRKKAFGFTPNEERLVDYLTPFGDYWPFEKRDTLYRMHKDIRAYLDIAGHDSDFILVDSYVFASDGDAAMGGQKSATEFFAAIAYLGRPAFVIAHTASGERHPSKPFGSVFVHNSARETWSMERDAEGSFFDPVEDAGVVALELRNQKANDGGQYPQQFLNFHFRYGEIEVTPGEPAGKSIVAMAEDVLYRAGTPLLTSEIAKSIRESEGVSVKLDSLGKKLRAARTTFRKVAGQKSDKGAARWTLHALRKEGGQ